MRGAIVGGILLTTALAAQAQQPKLPLWEVGGVMFGVSQQAYPGSDQNILRGLPLPYFIYRGDVLRADEERMGLRALTTADVELDFDFAGAFGSSGGDIEARQGMPDLGTLVEVGPRLKWHLGQAAGGRWMAEFPLRAVFDLSDGMASRGFSFEPGLQYARFSPVGVAYRVGLSALIGNRRHNDVFYTVAPEYATAERPTYASSSGLIAWRLGVSAGMPLNADWRLFGFARLNTVAGAANQDSPLVRRDHGASVGLGVTWTWMRSEALAKY
jgi:MipA family protein